MQDKSEIAKAIGAGKTITTTDFAVVFLIGVAAIEWWLSDLLGELGEYAAFLRIVIIAESFAWFAPLGVIINWFVSYGGLDAADAEFYQTRKSLTMSFLLWLALNALHVLLLNYRGWFDF